jgi:uncharacterized iron-regulated protein
MTGRLSVKTRNHEDTKKEARDGNSPQDAMVWHPTLKALNISAQGWRRSRLPWGESYFDGPQP